MRYVVLKWAKYAQFWKKCFSHNLITFSGPCAAQKTPHFYHSSIVHCSDFLTFCSVYARLPFFLLFPQVKSCSNFLCVGTFYYTFMYFITDFIQLWFNSISSPKLSTSSWKFTTKSFKKCSFDWEIDPQCIGRRGLLKVQSRYNSEWNDTICEAEVCSSYGALCQL